ncbi:MAG: hypothetical protein ACTHX0_11455, partial [Brachybacterium sp.]
KKDRILLVTTGQESEVDEDEAETPEIVDTEPAASAAPAGEAASEGDVEIPAEGAPEGVTGQGDVLGSDESDQSSTDDADPNEE